MRNVAASRAKVPPPPHLVEGLLLFILSGVHACARSQHPASVATSRLAFLANQNKRTEILALAKSVSDPADTSWRQAVVMRHLAKIIVAALRPASAILQQQIGHIPNVPSAESRTACGMRPAFRRGWEGEGKPKSMPWRGPAGRASDRHTGGVYFGLGNERAMPLAFQPASNSAGQALMEKRSGSPTTAPSHGATQPGDVAASRASDKAVARSAAPPSKRARARRSSGKKRGESASGSAQKTAAPLRSA